MHEYKFIEARFTNNERDTIAAIFEDNGRQFEMIVPADDNDATYQEILKNCSIDYIHENTFKYIKDQEKAVTDALLQIAKERDWFYDIDGSEVSNIYKAIVKSIFTSEESKEKLFLLKLELFETEFVKSCKDKNLKSRLRKSQTTLDAIKTAIEIYENLYSRNE